MTKKKTTKGLKKSMIAAPLLCCAAICEKVLMEGQMPSLIRVVDIIQIKPPELQEGFDGIELPMRIYLSFRKGDSRPGKHECDISLRDPKGKVSKYGRMGFGFDEKAEPNQVANADLPLKVKWSGFGIYRFELTLDGVLVGAIPFKMDEQKQPTTGQ